MQAGDSAKDMKKIRSLRKESNGLSYVLYQTTDKAVIPVATVSEAQLQDSPAAGQ
jgi:hypothetical protein